jgi:outer membrane protein
MKKITICAGIFFFTIMLAAEAFALPGIDVEAAIGGWMQSPAGDVSYISGGLTGLDTTLDFEDDFKYDDQTRLSGRVKVDIPVVPSVYLMASPSEFDGDGLKDVDFSFGDFDFSGTEPFYSKVTLNQYDIGLYYSIPLLKTATLKKLNVDVGLNARIMDIKGEIEQDSTVYGLVKEEASETIPVPMLYLAAQFTPIERIALEAEGRGISIGGNTVMSVIARLRVKVFGPAFAAAGYRFDSIDIDEDDVKLDTDIAGPFFEAGVKF